MVKIYPLMEVYHENGMSALHITCCRAHSKVLAQHAAFMGHKYFAKELAMKGMEMRILVTSTWKVSTFMDGLMTRKQLKAIRESIEGGSTRDMSLVYSPAEGKSTYIRSNQFYIETNNSGRPSSRHK